MGNLKNLKKNPISSILGLMIIIFAGVLLFIPTLYDIPLWGIAIIAVSGTLLLFAEDKFISILTLGLSKFVNNKTENNNIKANRVGGELGKKDDEEGGTP